MEGKRDTILLSLTWTGCWLSKCFSKIPIVDSRMRTLYVMGCLESNSLSTMAARSSWMHVSRNDRCRVAFPVAILLCSKYALKCCHCLNSVIVAFLSNVRGLNSAAFRDGSVVAMPGSTSIFSPRWCCCTSSDCRLFSYSMVRSVAFVVKSSTCCLKFSTFRHI